MQQKEQMFKVFFIGKLTESLKRLQGIESTRHCISNNKRTIKKLTKNKEKRERD